MSAGGGATTERGTAEFTPPSPTGQDLPVDAWEKANAEFLAAALAWLRLRLEQHATAHPSVVPVPVTEPPGNVQARRRPRRRRRNADPAPASLSAVGVADLGDPATRNRVTDAEVDDAFERMQRARDADTRPALRLLAERLGLTTFEEHLLLLCAGRDLDPSLGRSCSQANGDPSWPHPTFALAMTMFDDAAWDAVSPERPLRLWRLIDINQADGDPLTLSALRADERIVSYIKGLNYLDDRLAPLLVPFDPLTSANLRLPASQQDMAAKAASFIIQGSGGQSSPVVQLVGSDPSSSQLVANHIAEQVGLHLFRLPAAQLPQGSADLLTLSRLWERESVLLPIALYLDIGGGDATTDQPERDTRSAVRRFLDRTNGVFLVGTRDVLPQLGTAGIAVDLRKPMPIEQRQAWQDGPAALIPADAAVLAGQFNLDLATIDALSRRVVASDDDGTPFERAWQACLTSTRPRLDLLAHRLDARASWDDIVLPDEANGLLHEIADQARTRSHVYDEWGFRSRMSRGLGISALFAGESGTGKTMAAEVLAGELGLNLYRIDLSAVVSKYIGETEKNLRQLFDAAEDGGAILFFDEADALFGKRSEVKDSHDRYANIEVNYLLQRMEAYEGLAILATNLRNALDRAFLRRLRFIVTFPFPGVAERAEIWRRAFPRETPLADLDVARLGRLDLTGGSIANVALNAAFTAARDDGHVTMPLVLDAARAEFRKLNKPINEADFRWEAPEEVA
jgi:hypothetical protein